MKALTTALKDALAQGSVGNVATAWKIIPSFGDPLGFTSWDQWVWWDSAPYNPDVGVSVTEMDSQSIGTKVSTMQFRGLLGAYVSKSDIRFRWGGAKLLIFNFYPVYNGATNRWEADTAKGLEILRFGDIGNIKDNGDGTFNAEFRSISQRASVSFGVTGSPLCRYRFCVDDGYGGPSRCPVDLATKQHTVTLTSIADGGLTLVFTLATTDDFLTSGFVEALDGENVGIDPQQIDFHTQSGTTATVHLFDTFPLPLLAGASLRITEGCQKREDPDCLRHTGDAAPHGGFNDLAGPDFLLLRVK